MRLLLATLLIAALLGGVPPAGAQDAGRVFEPRPMTTARYGTGPRTPHYVTTDDGTRIYVETALPVEKDGNVPPTQVPTVLLMSPYVGPRWETLPSYDGLVRYFTQRGYAVALGHVLGTGASEGCIQYGGRKEVEATAEVIAYLGDEAPWSNGRVGMLGGSYDGMAQLGAAALDDPRVRPLKAIVPLAAVPSWIENAAFDGVPSVPGIAFGWVLYHSAYSSPVATPDSATVYAGRYECSADALAHAAEHDVTGDLTPYWRERDYRWGVRNIRAATLLVHGFNDRGNPALHLSGLFEHLPASTPHKLLLGQWGHEWPHNQKTHPEWRRTDFLAMMQAWFDRYLLDLPTGVEDWPTVQVQDSSGQWRAERDWPAPTRRYGHLALTAGASLGAGAPAGATTYTEAGSTTATVTFTTPPLADDLHLTGQTVLDLWVRLDRPDAHIAAAVSAVDAAGNAVGPVAFFGARSARHLDPMPDNWFRQEGGDAPAVGVPVRVPVRLSPTDYRIPKGGRLTVTVGASLPYLNEFPSAPSGAGTTVTILHDCAHPSALRFFLPKEEADLLNVREPDEGDAPLVSSPAPPRSVDGGGIATARVCGERPVDPLDVLAGTA